MAPSASNGAPLACAVSTMARMPARCFSLMIGADIGIGQRRANAQGLEAPGDQSGRRGSKIGRSIRTREPAEQV